MFSTYGRCVTWFGIVSRGIGRILSATISEVCILLWIFGCFDRKSWNILYIHFLFKWLVCIVGDVSNIQLEFLK